MYRGQNFAGNQSAIPQAESVEPLEGCNDYQERLDGNGEVTHHITAHALDVPFVGDPFDFSLPEAKAAGHDEHSLSGNA